MNDNAPEWVDGTLDGPFWETNHAQGDRTMTVPVVVAQVREMAATGVVIGSVLAVDIDGPLYNQVRYTIRAVSRVLLGSMSAPRADRGSLAVACASRSARPRTNAGRGGDGTDPVLTAARVGRPTDSTPEDLVTIDFYTGQMSVNLSGAIDADVPRRWHLFYTVIASDCCYAEDPADCPPDPTCYDTPGEALAFRSWVVHDRFWSQVGRLIVASCPGVFSSGIRSRRFSGDGSISEVQVLKFPESAGDLEELSVDTPSSSSIVTAGSGSNDEVVDRRSV
ncbi:hypothetical protein EVAR_48933_1 [Eumeta japonica]|uniref:Uncharacterized protein n=1 Tax=Eumeta variegata TaxID=151549 RepID=A0A4C1YXX8_EUMVA|nr:hypothetical protein EVAR_48933_1 [Eumeta japonica]